jgi:hypothetical protein
MDQPEALAREIAEFFRPWTPMVHSTKPDGAKRLVRVLLTAL